MTLEEFENKFDDIQTYDYIEIIDKNTKKVKNIFVPEKHLEDVKKMLGIK